MTTPVPDESPSLNTPRNDLAQQEPRQQQTSPTDAKSVTVTDIDDPSHPLHHHRRTVADFEYGENLGEGSYSTVIIGRDKKTDKQYAIKKLDKAHIVKNDKVKYVMIERDALSRMNHPGIVKLYWTFRDNRSLYYVIDLASHGELYTFIRKMAPLDMVTTRYYASEILLAVDHIHSKGVVHRDIKPENILLDDQMHIKIADFGSAKLLASDVSYPTNSSGTRSFVGTAEYVSPELLRSDPTLKEADWWAFGCVIFQMLSGRSPFKAATDYLIFQKIKNLDYEFSDDFPDIAKDLVQRLLVLEPDKRLGSEAMGGVDVIKQHPFFEGADFDQAFNLPAPSMAQQYMDDWKWQQAQQQLNKENSIFDEQDNDNDGFETWFNGNERQQVDAEDTSPRQRRQQRYQQQQQHLRLQYEEDQCQQRQQQHYQQGHRQKDEIEEEEVKEDSHSPYSGKIVTTGMENPFSDAAATNTASINDPPSAISMSQLHSHSSSSLTVEENITTDELHAAIASPTSASVSNTSAHVLHPSSSSRITSNSSHSTPFQQSESSPDSLRASFSTRHSIPERLGNQSHPPWIAHLYPSESIVRAGKVARRRGLFSKKRYLILTDRPRLLYLDEGQEQDGSGGGLRCEIGWTSKLLPELKGKSVFSIHTPEKSYTFDVAKGQAQDWVNTINTMLVDSFGLAA